jgi:hypothetical protein
MVRVEVGSVMVVESEMQMQSLDLAGGQIYVIYNESREDSRRGDWSGGWSGRWQQ